MRPRKRAFTLEICDVLMDRFRTSEGNLLCVRFSKTA
jgi:hypothetical protein